MLRREAQRYEASTDSRLPCGALRYGITRVPNAVHTCRCTACRHLTGGAFALTLLPDGEAFRLAGPEPRPFRRAAGALTRWTCAECGAWVCSGPKPGPARPPDAFREVRAGTLGDTSWLRPALHFWARSAQPWVVLPPGGRSLETQLADFDRAGPLPHPQRRAPAWGLTRPSPYSAKPLNTA